MKPSLILTVGVWSAFMTIGLADPADTTPSGPLLNRMGDFSAMEITYSYAQDQAKASAGAPSAPPLPAPLPSYVPVTPPRVVTLTRTKPIWHVVRVDTLGNKIEQWSNGTDVFCVASGLPEPMLDTHDVYSGFPDYTVIDFPDMGWVSLQTYQGVQPKGGRPCLVFAKDDMTAWVDAESRLPVQWQKGGETRTFRQLPPPTERLELPSKIAALAAIRAHDFKRLLRPIVNGG